MSSSNSSFERRAFTTSRLAEFCSVKELTTQTRLDPTDWPLVVVRELLENGIDAAEQAGVAPVVDIKITPFGGIIVTDQTDLGVARKTGARMIDYSMRNRPEASQR